MSQAKADIGVFGGSGFYKFLDDVQELEIDTEYGSPSDKINIAEISGKKVAFLPRHGAKHQFPAHMVNYKANLSAMKQLGVKRIIGPCAAGSLKKEIEPGDIVVSSDIVDMTKGRDATFYNGPTTVHVHMSEPYCPDLRKSAIKVIKDTGKKVHEQGTMVVINGPRFATKAESQSFINNGWDVINMTQYPESYLAKELDMCYVNLALITDYDIGVEGVPPSPVDKILETFAANNEKLKDILFKLIEEISIEQTSCNCKDTYQHSAIN